MVGQVTVEQKDVVETFIARKDEREYNYHVKFYMTGRLDVYEILKQFNLTKE